MSRPSSSASRAVIFCELHPQAAITAFGCSRLARRMSLRHLRSATAVIAQVTITTMSGDSSSRRAPQASSAAAIASPSYWFVRQPCIWIENFLSERILVMSLINARRPVVDGAARPVRIFSRRLRARHISRIFPIALKSSRIGPASSFWRSANIFSYLAAFFASGSKRPRKVIHSRIVSRMSEMSPTA